MSLIAALGPIFPPEVRARGVRYFAGGAVNIVHGDGHRVEAFVQGTGLYDVEVTRDGGSLEMFCTCPYFEDNEVCKHVWATVVAAESFGYLEDDRKSRTRPSKPAASPTWAEHLRAMAGQTQVSFRESQREILYGFDVGATLARGKLTLDVQQRERKRDGNWGKRKAYRVASDVVSQLSDVADRQIFAMLVGAQEHYGGYYYRPHRADSYGQVSVPSSMIDALVPLICQTGRAWLKVEDDEDPEPEPLSWDDGPAWELTLQPTLDGLGRNYVLIPRLERDERQMSIDEPAMLLTGGFVFGYDRLVAPLNDFGAFHWISLARSGQQVTVPVIESDPFLAQLLALPSRPRLDLPEPLQYEEVVYAPQPRLHIHPGNHHSRLRAELTFDYEGHLVSGNDPKRGFFRIDGRRFLLRDEQAEANAAKLILELGFRPDDSGSFEFAARNLPKAVASLVAAGWHVEAEGSVYRPAGPWRMKVSSGVDWFGLDGEVEFGSMTASLPELLEAVRRGESFVRLGDGTVGILPEEWLKKYGLLAGMGTVDGKSLRFKRAQVGLLDALVSSQPEVEFDEAFSAAREQLTRFDGVKPVDAPRNFVGELRGYQREGLGWLGFLQQFGFGGCLADDMGLGKTIQVLALLESRRGRGAKKKKPSLVVVPKSLMFNWRQEAERFTPKLRLLDHIGSSRLPAGEHFEDYDVIVTTYGTLRRDAVQFLNVEFDYCILDEAQAIKNASTASAKAARLLKADHRLALSGTPIENHLGELWSLFEFLNPGMLGVASAFQLGTNGNRNPDESTRAVLARTLRPFILRRTKDQVAKDLPPKTEQTLYCELEGAQRRHYEQLRDHYRRSLLARVDREGMQKSKMFVLEALLRLRQAACHPGLIDSAKFGQTSAKLDVLLPHLTEVSEEGHKALVFSQFTKMLAIVRDRLDREGVRYEYLDGRTRDRKARVESFQNDPDCKLFLISLKAGGLGLNLTAAEYVFLLDPWWNPAVEAQAIDRTHRIGQKMPVFAYRIIARNTVEEKVLELQDSKRALADAIITADNSLIRRIQREDLELLLS